MDPNLEELVTAVVELVQQFPGVPLTHTATRVHTPHPLQERTTNAFLEPAQRAANALADHQDDPQALREALVDAAKGLARADYDEAVDGWILGPMINKVNEALGAVAAAE